MNENEINALLKNSLGEGSEILQPLFGGMMNMSYIVKDKDDKKYVLYISTEQANEMVDRPLEKAHQRIVYELGLTSKNVYFDTDKGIKINEFIEGNSLDKIDECDYRKVADLLKRLHSSIMLSRDDYDPFGRFINIYEKESLEFQDEPSPLYTQLRNFLFEKKDYLEAQMKTLCHNDAQKSNIIRASNEEYCLIDFEFMANNDPIYDIATFGNGLVSEGRKLLDYYFDNKVDSDKIKRYYLWRIFISLQWYNVAITKHFRKEGEKHNIDFLKVANHFLNNAQTAYDSFKLEIQENIMQDDTEKLIIQTLDKIRHFLQRDGGDCEFVSFKNGIVYVRLHGACQGCSYASADLEELVEVILQEEVPGVLQVKLADE